MRAVCPGSAPSPRDTRQRGGAVCLRVQAWSTLVGHVPGSWADPLPSHQALGRAPHPRDHRSTPDGSLSSSAQHARF